MSKSLITITEGVNYKVVSRDFKIFNNKIFICSHYSISNRWVAQISCYDLQGNPILTFGNKGKVVLTSFQNTTESFQLKLHENCLYLIGTSQKKSRDGFVLKLNSNTGQTVNNFGQNGIVMFDILGKNDFVVDFLLENGDLVILGYTSLNGYFVLFLMRLNILTGRINPITNTYRVFNPVFTVEYRNGIMLIYKSNTDMSPKSFITDQDSIVICGGILNQTWDGFIIRLSKNYIIQQISIENYLDTYDMNSSIVYKPASKLLLLTTVTSQNNSNIVRLSQYHKGSLEIDTGFKSSTFITMNGDLAGKKILADGDRLYLLCNSNNSVYIFCISPDNTYTTLQFSSKQNKSIFGNNIEIFNNTLYVEIDLHLNVIIQSVDKNNCNIKIEL
jgi:hypothetical protein